MPPSSLEDSSHQYEPTSNISQSATQSSFGRSSFKSSAAPMDVSLDKSKLELQKVLSLIITRLRERARPPTLTEQLSLDWSKRPQTRVDAMVQTFRAVVRTGSSSPKENPLSVSDDLEDLPSGFSTAPTLDLMVQLREILVMARKQRWDIMPSQESSTSFVLHGSRPQSGLSSPFRRRKSNTGHRGHTRSAEANVPLISDLRSSCISLLAEIIAEDCRYKVLSPRLATPPHTLQAVCLDVAIALLEEDPKPHTMASIGLAVLPAFDTFDPRLYPRLLAFFEEALVHNMLDQLTSLQASGFEDSWASRGTQGNKKPAVSIYVGHADELTEQSLDHHAKPWSSLQPSPSLISSFAPHQHLDIYRLSSLLPPLLASVLDKIDPSKAIPEIRNRLQRLYQLIIDSKPDAYLDLLQVAAYHSSSARHSAISLLANYWPEALGHVTTTRRLSFWPDRQNQDANPKIDPYEHEFIPWRFPAQKRRMTTGVGDAEVSVSDTCQACGNALHGFGLRCTLCCCTVHFNCYDSPYGSFLSQYPPAHEGGTHRVAITRFSRLLPRRRGEEDWDLQVKSGHVLRPVNLFNLTTCFVCSLPLWGCIAQGLQCAECQQFAHHTCCGREMHICSSQDSDSTHITIDFRSLKSSFLEYYHDLLLGEEQIMHSSYEDVSIIYGALWIQLQLMMNGVASGSIIIVYGSASTSGPGNRMEEFELQNRVRLIEAYLASGRNIKTQPVQQHQRLQTSGTEDSSILFDWSLLAYVVAAIKSAIHVEPANSPSLLDEPGSSQSPEIVTLAKLRDALASEINVGSDSAARHLLTHLHAVGLFRRVDRRVVLFNAGEEATQVYCAFPVPLLIDTSVDVEALVTTIEAGLEEIDLSLNEQVLLLLVLRCWPTIWASEYGLDRLAQALLSWICTEDERLLVVARDYVAHKKPLPGVLFAEEPSAWPWTPSNRLGIAGNAHSGGGYVASRKTLLVRYVAPWLRALHELDRKEYASIVFEHCSQAALTMRNIVEDIFEQDAQIPQSVRTQWGEDVLRYILKVCMSSTIFSSFESVFISWLDATSGATSPAKIVGFPSLPRLFNMDADSVRNQNIDPVSGESATGWSVQPWKVINDVVSSGQEGLARAMKWLLVLAQSGIIIPVTTYSQTAAFIRDFNSDFEAYEQLMECITATCWLRADSALDVLALVTTLHERLRDWIQVELEQTDHKPSIERFIRMSLASCLMLIGVDREKTVSSGLLSDAEVQRMPSRRRTLARNTMDFSTLYFNLEIMEALAHYVQAAPENVCENIASFLDVLISPDSPLVSDALDQFITINSHPLAQCVWRFYDVRLSNLAAVRGPLLLRLIVVDDTPIVEVINADLSPGSPSITQLKAVTRLSSIVFEVTSPDFQKEQRTWRSRIVSVVNVFFSLLWSEDMEDARHSADVSAKTLTQTHREALSRCWGEHVLQVSRVEKIRLASFLLRLHPYFPDWRLLNWDSIKECMLEDDFMAAGGEESGDILSHLRGDDEGPVAMESGDAQLLRVLLVSLCLHFIGDGITLDINTALKIKHHLTKVLDFQNTRLVPTNDTFSVQFDGLAPIPILSQPCVNALVRAIDCPTSMDIKPSVMNVYNDTDTPHASLIGSLFGDILLAVVTTMTLSDMPYLMARAWLEMLIIFILKHDIESPILKHLAPSLIEAVRKTTDLVQQDIPDDLRHLALSVSHAFLHARPNMCAKILSRQIVAMITVLSNPEAKSDSVLVAQGKAFLESAFSRFTPLGLFKSLFKKDTLSLEFFDTLREILKADARVKQRSGEEPLQDVVLRSVLVKMVEPRNSETEADQQESIRHISNNLLRFVERVHHEKYSEALMTDVAHALTNIARKTAEWPSTAFSPDAFLHMACLIVQHNKALSRDLLLHMETLLRASLLRFNVSLETLKRIFSTTGTLFRRASTIAFEVPANHLALAVIELLGEELRGRDRSTPISLASMIDVIASSFGQAGHPLFTTEILARTTSQTFGFLEATRAHERFTQGHLEPVIAAARLILQASAHQGEGVISQAIGASSGRANVPLKVWSALALAHLESRSTGASTITAVEPKSTTLLVHMLSFGISYQTTLNSLSDQLMSGAGLPPSTGAEVNHAYAAIKLWLLLAQRTDAYIETDADEVIERVDPSGSRQGGDLQQRRIWNETWPPFERLLNLTAQSNDDSSLPIVTMIWTSYVDLLTFLLTSGSVLATDCAVTHTTMLQRLCGSALAESSVQKLVKCLIALQNPPPLVPYHVQLERARGDFLAAEKLANILSASVNKRMDGAGGFAGIARDASNVLTGTHSFSVTGAGSGGGERRREFSTTH